MVIFNLKIVIQLIFTDTNVYYQNEKKTTMLIVQKNDVINFNYKNTIKLIYNV